MTQSNLDELKRKVEEMNSDELIELIAMSIKHANFNPTMVKILKTYLVRKLRAEGYL